MNRTFVRWLAVLLVLLGSVLAHADVASDQAVYRFLLRESSYANVDQTFRDITAFGSRMAGSAGEAKTFDYVEKRLGQLGFKGFTRRSFPVAVPDPNTVGRLSVLGHSAKVYPLWPNLVRTSTCDVAGTVYYAGQGTLEELSGKRIAGSIVVLEFNSGANWRNAAKWGAKAVVFLQPQVMPRAQAELKFSSVPLDIPRFFLPLAEAGPVLSAAYLAKPARLTCSMKWEDASTCNLSAYSAGTDPKLANQPICLFAYADSVSIVPGLAPGAESIGGIAGLLECALIFSSRPHARPLQVVLSGAHGEALLGARQMADQALADNLSPLVTITLDLSSGSPSLGCFGRGWFYETRDESQWPVQALAVRLRAHIDNLAAVQNVEPARLLMIDAVNNGDDRGWKNDIPGKFALDCEPLLLAGMTALTFRTTDDARETTDTPFDRIEQVKISNVFHQIQTTAAMVYHLLNDPLDRSSRTDDALPIDESVRPSRFRLTGGFGTLIGQVVSYDPQKSFLPDQKEPGTMVALVGDDRTYMGVRGDIIEFSSGPNADYKIAGVATINSYTDQHRHNHIEAYHLDSRSGRIDKSVTWQLSTFGSFDNYFRLTTSIRESPIVVFPCVTVDLYDLVDPQNLTALSDSYVMDPRTGSPPKDFAVFEPPYDKRLDAESDDTQVLFLPKGQQFQVTSGSMDEMNRAILTNSDLGDEKGQGYTAPGGVTVSSRRAAALSGTFQNLPFQTASDILNINQTRLDRFAKYRIVNGDVGDLQNSGKRQLQEAEVAANRLDWAEAERAARAAWGYALKAHPIIMATANDVVNGVIFYLFLLIPFSYFVERLAIGSRLLSRQLAWSVGFFIIAFLLLRIIHPAFEIVTNPSMIFIAFVMGALSLIVIGFVVSKFQNSMKSIRAQQVGVHDVDINRSSVAMAAFALGIGNMRRRKARTTLTTFTLVVMTFIVLSFMSIVPKLQIQETPSANSAGYSGILVRMPGMDPLEMTTYRQIQNEFSDGQVIRRVYYYGSDIGTKGILTLQRGEGIAEVRAMLGLDPAEDQVLKPQQALFAGRWFKPGERNVMVLPESVAKSLKIDASELGKAQVSYAGVPFTVIGLANESVLRATKDLDGDGVLPPDFTLTKDLQELKGNATAAFRSFVRLDPGSVFIVPAETALELGGDLRTLAVHFDRPEETQAALATLMPRLRLNLYAGVPEKPGNATLVVKQFSVQQGSKSSGLFLVLIQLVIAATFVLNTMVASVYERTREISIFGSIGLAPNHIAMLFFAESLVYGVLGSVIGFFVAQITAKIVISTHSLQGLTLNFSSTSAVLAAVLVMGVVLGSTIYPAKLATKIAAPAMNEKVFESEPDGDVWNLPLPFSINSRDAAPISRFLQSWLQAYEGFTIGEFVSADTLLVREGDVFQLASTVWLSPYDLGVSQRVILTMAPALVEGVYTLDLQLTRLAGDPENWPIVNRRFLGIVRKEFLTWRTLAADQRAAFAEPDAFPL